MKTHGGARAVPLRAGLRPIFAVALLAAGQSSAPAAQTPPALEARATVLALADARRWDGVQLAQLATHPDAGVRAATADLLGLLANPEAVPLLARLGSDRNAAVRAAAAAATGRLAGGLADDDLLKAPLERLLGDREPAVRRAAAWAVAVAAKSWSGRLLTAALGRESDASVRAALLVDLWRAPGEEWLQALTAALADRDPAPRYAAAHALSRRPGEVATAALLAAVRDDDVEVRRIALVGIGRAPAVEVRDAVLGALADADAGVRVAALGALEEAAAKGVLGELPETTRTRLAALVNERAPERVHERVAAIRAAGAAKCCAAGLQVAVSAAEPWVSAEALEALAVQGESGVDELIEAWWARPEPEARAAAVRAAARRNRLQQIQRGLADASPLVRSVAVERLAQMPQQRRGNALSVAAANADPVVRAAALEALARAGAIAPRDLVTLLKAEQQSDPPDPTIALIRVAGASKNVPPAVFPLLVRLQASPNPWVGREAWRALRRHGSASPLPQVATGRDPSFYRRVVEWAATGRWLTLVTVRGTVVIALDTERAPLAAYRLSELAENKFYDDLTFHRVALDFVVQGGDPRGDGSGGPGFVLRDELSLAPYSAGAVGLALDGPDSGGSQLFVTLTRQPHLDGQYPLVGRVIDGFDVVWRLRRGDRILRARAGEGAPPAYVPVWYGSIEPARLDAAFPAYPAEREKYVPQTERLELLRSAVLHYELTVAMGTWCGDSREQVPRLQKVLAALGDRSPFASPRLLGVDRSKALDAADWPYGAVELVPTIVVSTGGVEIGRIAETPASGSIEEDLVRILAPVEGWEVPPPAIPTPLP